MGLQIQNRGDSVNVEGTVNANLVSQDINPNVVVKLMNEAASNPGLLSIHNSMAYRVAEIERHFHSGARWFGAAAVPTATHKADRPIPGVTPFQIDAGNDDWGAWVQILGSDDTPTRAGRVYFDPHELIVVDTERTDLYFIQFGRGASGAEALANGTYTEEAYYAPSPRFGGPIQVQTGRAPAGSLLWARCFIPTINTGTIDFYIGIHEYEG